MSRTAALIPFTHNEFVVDGRDEKDAGSQLASRLFTRQLQSIGRLCLVTGMSYMLGRDLPRDQNRKMLPNHRDLRVKHLTVIVELESDSPDDLPVAMQDWFDQLAKRVLHESKNTCLDNIRLIGADKVWSLAPTTLEIDPESIRARYFVSKVPLSMIRVWSTPQERFQQGDDSVHTRVGAYSLFT